MRNHSLCLRCNGQVTEIEGNVCDSLQDKDKEKFSREVLKTPHFPKSCVLEQIINETSL